MVKNQDLYGNLKEKNIFGVVLVRTSLIQSISSKYTYYYVELLIFAGTISFNLPYRWIITCGGTNNRVQMVDFIGGLYPYSGVFRLRWGEGETVQL